MASPATITYGPIFIGVIFNLVLYGIMITQTFLYFTSYKRDKLWMKLYVTLLFICDTLNSAFDVAFVYIPLVQKYGDVEALSYATWVFSTDPAMTAIIALLVQTFFAWRVKVLTNSWPMTIFIAFCSFCQWCGGMGTAIACGIIPEFIHFQKFKVIVIIWLAFSAVADTAITIALVLYLRTHKTGFSATDDLVNKIIRLTVQTGMITAVCAVVDLIAFLGSPSGLHLVFNLPLAKLYTNSLMSSLNSRSGWKYGSGGSRGPTESGMSSNGGNRLSVGRASNMRPNQQIYIDVESHELKDRDDSRGPFGFKRDAVEEIGDSLNELSREGKASGNSFLAISPTFVMLFRIRILLYFVCFTTSAPQPTTDVCLPSIMLCASQLR